MIICLEVWQAIVIATILSFVFVWAGYATAKIFTLSDRDIKQRKYINSLRGLLESKEEKERIDDFNGRINRARNSDNTNDEK